MLVAYFDEVKFQKGRSPYYWLGAIVASPESIWQLEGRLNDLSEEVFGTRELLRSTEFHAADLLNGHEHFKGWDWEKRISVLKRLIDIFGKAEELGKIYVRMDVAKMLSSDVEGIAFMYMVERVELYLRGRKEPGLLIGDRESDTVSGAFAESLSQYRNAGTRFHFGRQLTHLIDTVHFTSSHHSRMLQLADLHVWLRQLAATGSNDKWHRTQVLDHIGTIDGCLYANKVKIWPTNDAWLGVTQVNP